MTGQTEKRDRKTVYAGLVSVDMVPVQKELIMIALIVARSRNNVIGKGGKIPWKIRGEQDQFRQLTAGNTVIMGRRTYEEIGNPLPGRETIVISRTGRFSADGLRTAPSLDEALEMAAGNDVYIAGGYSLYKEAIPLADVMYITEVDLVIEDGDVFFPDFDEEDFDRIDGETLGDGIRYKRTEYRRRLTEGDESDRK